MTTLEKYIKENYKKDSLGRLMPIKRNRKTIGRINKNYISALNPLLDAREIGAHYLLMVDEDNLNLKL